jgi:regulator of replication initiation timing
MSEDMMPQRSDLVGKYDSYISENKKLRAEIENLRDRLYLASIKVADARVEANKLRARIEVLEKVRAAAQDLEGYGFGWLHWEEKFETLRSALREAKP